MYPNSPGAEGRGMRDEGEWSSGRRGNRGEQNRKGIAGSYAMKYSFRQNVQRT